MGGTIITTHHYTHTWLVPDNMKESQPVFIWSYEHYTFLRIWNYTSISTSRASTFPHIAVLASNTALHSVITVVITLLSVSKERGGHTVQLRQQFLLSSEHLSQYLAAWVVSDCSGLVCVSLYNLTSFHWQPAAGGTAAAQNTTKTVGSWFRIYSCSLTVHCFSSL